MQEIASQLVLEWARLAPLTALDPVDDINFVTFDTIGLCAMDVRLNLVNDDGLHPFMGDLKYFTLESGRRVVRPEFVSEYLMRGSAKQYWESIDAMKAFAQDSIDFRKHNPVEKEDLLMAML